MCLKKLKKYSYKEVKRAIRFAERSTAKLILSNINDVIPSAPPRMLTGTEQDVLEKVNFYADFYEINLEKGAQNERKSETSTTRTERKE